MEESVYSLIVKEYNLGTIFLEIKPKFFFTKPRLIKDKIIGAYIIWEKSVKYKAIRKICQISKCIIYLKFLTGEPWKLYSANVKKLKGTMSIHAAPKLYESFILCRQGSTAMGLYMDT